MKRVRPAASIQEWVATHVALAVKCKRIQQLEEQIKRYNDILTKEKSQNRFKCTECEEWFENIDVAVCEGVECPPVCQGCEDRYFCSYCGDLKCVACTHHWCSNSKCLFVVCKDCDWRTTLHNCPDLRNN